MTNPFKWVVAKVTGVEYRLVTDIVADFNIIVTDLRALEQRMRGVATKARVDLVNAENEAARASAVAAKIEAIVK